MLIILCILGFFFDVEVSEMDGVHMLFYLGFFFVIIDVFRVIFLCCGIVICLLGYADRKSVV